MGKDAPGLGEVWPAAPGTGGWWGRMHVSPYCVSPSVSLHLCPGGRGYCQQSMGCLPEEGRQLPPWGADGAEAPQKQPRALIRMCLYG